MTFLVNRKKILPVLAKTLVTLALISLVYSKIDLNSVIEKFKSINPTLLTFAFLCHIIAYSLYATRWVYLLKQLTDIANYFVVNKWYYFGLFCNNFLPTSFGGDVVRIYVLRKHDYSLENLIVSSFADRLIGFSSIILMGTVAVLFNPLLATVNLKYLFLVVLFIIAIGIATLFALKALKKYNTSKTESLKNKIAKKIEEITHIFSIYKHKKHELLVAFFTSFVAQFLIMLSYALLGLSLGLKLHFLYYFAVIPIVFLTSAIPVTIGGLGIREGTLISLLGLYSISYDDAAALSLLYLLLITVITLPAVLVPSFNAPKNTPQTSIDSKP